MLYLKFKFVFFGIKQTRKINYISKVLNSFTLKPNQILSGEQWFWTKKVGDGERMHFRDVIKTLSDACYGVFFAKIFNEKSPLTIFVKKSQS